MVAWIVVGAVFGVPPETLAFEVVEGSTQNRFYRQGEVAAHVVATSGDRPRLVVAFPAGNTGLGLWFEGSIQLRVEGDLEPVRRGAMRGVRFVVVASIDQPKVQKAVVTSMRVLRDYVHTGLVPGAVSAKPDVQGKITRWARRRVDSKHAYELSMERDGSRLLVTALIDEKPLTPIPLRDLLNDRAAADPVARKALAFLSYDEKLLAGSWRFLTYFGRDNIAFGLKVRRVPKAEQDAAVADASSIVGMDDLLHRKPSELSGGQRQRVAVARAIVRKPDVFLFDEPLSNLDAKLRGQMRAEIIQLSQRLETTMIYVTHDQVEAMTMADRIVVFDGGRIQQAGTPQEVYERPANRFVAGFLGSPPMNFVPGSITEGRFTSTAGGVSFPLDSQAGPLTLGVRPEALRLDDEAPIARGTVKLVEYFGAESSVTLDAGGNPLVLLARGRPPRIGDEVSISLEPGRAHLFRE